MELHRRKLTDLAREHFQEAASLYHEKIADWIFEREEVQEEIVDQDGGEVPALVLAANEACEEMADDVIFEILQVRAIRSDYDALRRQS